MPIIIQQKNTKNKKPKPSKVETGIKTVKVQSFSII